MFTISTLTFLEAPTSYSHPSKWGRETILDLPGVKEEKPRSPRAAAWSLQPTHTEAIFGKNKRIVVGGEEVAYGGNLHCISPNIALSIYVFLMIL